MWVKLSEAVKGGNIHCTPLASPTGVIQWKATFKKLDIVPILYIAAFETRLYHSVPWPHHFVNDRDDIKKKPNKKDLAL